MRIQRKVGVARDRKAVHRESIERFRRLYLRRHCSCASNLGETVGDIKNEDDESAVRWAFDLKVTEERIGAEQIQSFVDYVRLLRVG